MKFLALLLYLTACNKPCDTPGQQTPKYEETVCAYQVPIFVGKTTIISCIRYEDRVYHDVCGQDRYWHSVFDGVK